MKKIDTFGISANRAFDIAQEAITLASLSHPNIIKYYDSFRQEDYFCIITDYCDVCDVSFN